jgi:hypothetical protein
VIYLGQPSGDDAGCRFFMNEQYFSNRQEQLRAQLRQLIIMRETGPKRAVWQAARARLIWRLHDELREASQEQEDDNVRPVEEETRD